MLFCHTRHSGVPDTRSLCSSLLTCGGFSPTRLGIGLLLAQAVFNMRTSFLCASSGLVHCFCLFAPNHDAHELEPLHRQSGLDCLGALRRGDRPQSVNEVKEDLEAKRMAAYGEPQRGCGGEPGPSANLASRFVR